MDSSYSSNRIRKVNFSRKPLEDEGYREGAIISNMHIFRFLAVALVLRVHNILAFQPRRTHPPVLCIRSVRQRRRYELPRLYSDPNDSGKEDVPSQPSPKNRLGSKAPPPGILRRKFPDFPWSRLPDWLTYARCAAIPVLAVIFYLPGWNVATASLFGAAAVTDWLDGFLARRWDITSDFGAFLDPVADKLMVATALILLSGRYGPPVALPTAVILSREIAVSALREWMAQRGERDTVQVGFQGKLKTALTMVSLTLLLGVPGDGMMTPLVNLYLPATILLYLCTVITVTSGIVYFKAAFPILFTEKQHSRR